MTDPVPTIPTVARLDRTIHRQAATIAVLVVAVAICASGWWLTSRDHSATERNGRAADCRSTELAITLDAFQVIVSPTATALDREQAADRLDRLPTLLARYQDCTG